MFLKNHDGTTAKLQPFENSEKQLAIVCMSVCGQYLYDINMRKITAASLLKRQDTY